MGRLLSRQAEESTRESAVVVLGCSLQGNCFIGIAGSFLPLYEGKMIGQFDHRFGTYDGQTQAQANKGVLPHLKDEQHADPHLLPMPKYWIAEEKVRERRVDATLGLYDFIFRDVTSHTFIRSGIFTIVPPVAIGHVAPMIRSERSPEERAALLAILNSVVADYLIRQNLGGAHLTFFVLKQIAIPSPKMIPDAVLLNIVPRVLELVYTAHDLTAFARDLGYDGDPFRWDAVRREVHRVELDAIVAHLYGLTADEFAHVLDSFSTGNGLKEQEIARWGEFRTKRLCMEAFDRLAADFDSEQFGFVQRPETAQALAAH